MSSPATCLGPSHSVHTLVPVHASFSLYVCARALQTTCASPLSPSTSRALLAQSHTLSRLTSRVGCAMLREAPSA
jgi:hypothetical protein